MTIDTNVIMEMFKKARQTDSYFNYNSFMEDLDKYIDLLVKREVKMYAKTLYKQARVRRQKKQLSFTE